MADENGLSKYVVQKFYDDESVWKDVRTVEVPPRTKRKTILEKAIIGTPEAGTFRVLDDESAREIPVTLEKQPDRVVIG